MAKSPNENRKPGFFRRLWTGFTTPSVRYSSGALLVVGVFAGVIFWGGFNWAMEASNTETFCISCHEMRDNVYEEYTETVHYNNRTGVRAVCADCHVPKEWIHKVIRKIRATNELYHHFIGSIDTREKFEAKRLQLAELVWASMKATDSRECRNCHDFESMDFEKQETRSADRHEEGFDDGKTCIDCHKGIAHKLPKGTFDQQPKAGIEPQRPQAANDTAKAMQAYLKKEGQ